MPSQAAPAAAPCRQTLPHRATGVAHDNTYCTTSGWTNFGTEFVPVAACFDPAGNPVGSGYTMTLLTLLAR